MSKKIGSIIVLIIIILASIVYGLMQRFQSPTVQKTQQPFVIGAILPLTGEAASYGETAKRSVDIAVKEIEKKEHIRLRIIYEDDGMVPKRAVSALQKLATQGVKYIIGFGSGETLALCPLAEKEKIILMSSGSSPKITNCGEYTYRNYPSDVYQGRVLAQKITEKGYSRVALIAINNEYGVGLKNEFEKNYKGTVLFSENHEAAQTDFRTLLAKIKVLSPDAIVLISQSPEGARFLSQKSEMGVTLPVYGSEALKDQKLIDSIPMASRDVFRVISIAPYDGDSAKDFAKLYEAQYGSKPGPYGDFVHDNALILASALQSCTVDDIECVKKNILATSVNGATGRIHFDKNGDIENKPYDVFVIKNNVFEAEKE